MEITAENTDDAEDADEEKLRWQAVRWIAFTYLRRRSSLRVCHPYHCSSVFSVSSASSVVNPSAVFRMIPPFVRARRRSKLPGFWQGVIRAEFWDDRRAAASYEVQFFLSE